MVATSVLRERGFAEVKRLCYAGLDAPTLLREVVGRLRPVVPFEAYAALTTDPQSGLLTQLMSDEIGGETERRTYLEHVYFEEEWDEQRRMVQNRVSVALLSEVTGGKLERCLRWREIIGPLGFGHDLVSLCTVGHEQWGTLCLLRERGRPDFNAGEVALLQRITPHVGAGLKAAALHAAASTAPVGDSVPGVLVLDDRGRVVQYTAAAERWLRDLEDLGPGWREGGGLPDPVWMVVGALRRALRPETEQDLHGGPHIRVQTRSGHWLTFHGARTQSHAGRAGETMIIVEPCGSRELAWLREAAYGLSERERAVVDRVAQGASTKEIARALFISEYTVQEHLSHAFDKVGVRGRRALVKRLFFDHLFPALCASSETGEAQLGATPVNAGPRPGRGVQI
jgi:DNA-binding CsgD family transcriptional regulator